ncbi:MAG: bifunctional metallophosphatase/5'-nucleotidase [Muribaculaceae bacterium]|nr:bifunctional metallophosphatase/5'-nucleotidase [Muribaculaceae bacterium]
MLSKILISAVAAGAALCSSADNLVILHTNDTHSAIDPAADGKGGILRRKVIVDSVRAARKNVMLVDAGDAVQGTLYYTLFGGEVERKLMDDMGYDLQILGNHEFDSGMEALSKQVAQSKAQWLTTNYDMSGTALDEFFAPYVIKEFDGKRIGFIAINLDPDGMISAANCAGVKYLDGMKAANSTAWHLKHNERVDMVVALSHIGYNSGVKPLDTDIAKSSEDIDIIIGGHSHTLINPELENAPEWRVANAAGDTILVVQTGSLGRYVGEIDIDLETLRPTYRLIPVDSRLDSRIDPASAAILEPYRHDVDSILGIKIGRAAAPLVKADFGLVNLITDIVYRAGSDLNGKAVDMAVMNKGGIRCDMPAGNITRGLIMQMLPFDNRIVLIDIKGSDLAAGFDVMAGRLGDGVSNASAVFDPATGKCTQIYIGGKPLDPEKTYRVATIDYLATGGDYMRSFKNATETGRSSNVLYDDVITYLGKKPYKGKKIKPDTNLRMTPKS